VPEGTDEMLQALVTALEPALSNFNPGFDANQLHRRKWLARALSTVDDDDPLHAPLLYGGKGGRPLFTVLVEVGMIGSETTRRSIADRVCAKLNEGLSASSAVKLLRRLKGKAKLSAATPKPIKGRATVSPADPKPKCATFGGDDSPLAALRRRKQEQRRARAEARRAARSKEAAPGQHGSEGP
jgi:hypothetical protein